MLLSFRVVLICILSKYGKEIQVCMSLWRYINCPWAHLKLAPGSVILIPKLRASLSLSWDLPHICSSQLCDEKRDDKDRTSPETVTAFLGRYVLYTCTLSRQESTKNFSPWGLRCTAVFMLPPILLCSSDVHLWWVSQCPSWGRCPLGPVIDQTD